MLNAHVYSSPSRKPTNWRKIIIIFLVVIFSIVVLAVLLLFLLGAFIFFGTSSYEKSCQKKADSIVSNHREMIAEFESINFTGGKSAATVKPPIVSRGDCIDSAPGMAIEENYVVSEPVAQAISDFDAAAVKAGYAPEYGDEPMVCNTDDTDATINTYENKSDRAAFDRGIDSGNIPEAFRDLIPQITCDGSGTTVTNLKVTFTI